MALEIISIHAPPRGATVWLDEEPLDWPFQFTPLREGRRQPGGKRRNTHDFNSRPSARGDVRAASRGRGLCISIHAPPRGATGVSASRSSVSLRISIHAPPRGATARQNVGDCIRVFQFTPLREGRLSQKSITPVGDYFNSRPSARGDSGQRPPSLLNPHFNSRPSARGDAIKGGSAIMYKFQFTPLREGRLPARFSLRASCTYFNSRPSARGDFSR